MTWECPICGLMNDDARDMCEDCGTPRPAGAVPAPSAPAPAVSAPEAPVASASGFAPRSLSVRLPPSILQHHRWAVLRGLGVPRPSRHIRLLLLPRRSLPPCPFHSPLQLLRHSRRLRQCHSRRLRQCHSRRLRQCHSPRRNPWRMLQLPLRFLRLRLPIQLWVSSFVSRTLPCLDATRFLLWLRTLPCPGSMPAFVLSGAHGWLPMRGPITERLLCVAARSSTWFPAWPSRFIPAIRYSFRLRLANLLNCV